MIGFIFLYWNQAITFSLKFSQELTFQFLHIYKITKREIKIFWYFFQLLDHMHDITRPMNSIFFLIYYIYYVSDWAILSIYLLANTFIFCAYCTTIIVFWAWTFCPAKCSPILWSLKRRNTLRITNSIVLIKVVCADRIQHV